MNNYPERCSCFHPGRPMTPRVVVLDYGSGNLRSAERALARAGADVSVTADPDAALDCDGLVVPGVGAFAACMAGLRAVGGDKLIARRIELGRPVLGICVGMQVLFAAGVEHGLRSEGCGVWPGTVERLDAPVLPHMGWNTVDVAPGSALFAGNPRRARGSTSCIPTRCGWPTRPRSRKPGLSSRSPSTASRSPPRSSSASCPRRSSTRKSPVTPEPWCSSNWLETLLAPGGRPPGTPRMGGYPPPIPPWPPITPLAE